MDTAEIIVLALIALIIGGAVAYIIKSKKSGKKCIGCPYGCSCSSKGKGGACSGCGTACDEDKK